ncbi:hypothetical protein EXW72_05130 [Pseudomonas sp. BCA14]|nr:hypothetical protein EXW70_07355 [Pseudomonas sp. JMN1]TFF15001.1 hypothetical protein EXW71_01685 [Pseudomonas sp. BCA17]TFF31407.1 hypothetical protein EXW72_05130 [Pseudomonas sp. BCA14]TFF32361.1 hypothetical protein EXW73_00935 [Pseudomonas sp. BCA13]
MGDILEDWCSKAAKTWHAVLILINTTHSQARARADAASSDTVFSLSSASVSKSASGGQLPHSRHPCRAWQAGACRSLPFGGVMTKMALFLFGFLVLTIGIGMLATISPV